MRRMLFNATHPEELRLAVVDGQKLLELDIESTAYQQKKGNTYKAKVTRVEPSLEAAFVDYGTERQGFLPLKEISRIHFQGFSDNTPISQVRIKDVIKEGQEFIVQVEKEERGSKGAALTTFISLAGRYLVLMPNNPKGGGISRRIEGEERAELREAMAQLQIPDDYSLIARTAGIGKSAEELQWDLDYLIHLWDAISAAGAERPAPFLIYQESNLVVRAVRDYVRGDIGEILIDNAEVYERIRKFMQQVSPSNLNKLKLYQDTTPLFSRFQIEHQIESAFSREVRLESGGSIVFDRTEALVTIDVNSARATRGSDIEETALNTNVEAADEIARQLRLRDLGGLVVIDFIDMSVSRNQREVESRLFEALKVDRARVQVGRISRFGMLEMSRQRLRPSLGEASSLVCPRCNGTGHIRSVQSSALNILRIIQEEAMKENTAAVHVHLPIETATFLLNEKRFELNAIESRIGTPIAIIPSQELDTPNYRIRRLRSDEYELSANIPSYDIEIVEDEDEEISARPAKLTTEKPAVGPLMHSVTAPVRKKTPFIGTILKFLKTHFSTEKKETIKPQARKDRPPRRRHREVQKGRDRNRPQQRANTNDKKTVPESPGNAKKAAPTSQQKERPEGGARPRGRRRGSRRGRSHKSVQQQATRTETTATNKNVSLQNQENSLEESHNNPRKNLKSASEGAHAHDVGGTQISDINTTPAHSSVEPPVPKVVNISAGEQAIEKKQVPDASTSEKTSATEQHVPSFSPDLPHPPHEKNKVAPSGSTLEQVETRSYNGDDKSE